MELYDLAEDPYERNDLFMARPHRVKAMRAELDGWREAEGTETKVKERYRTLG